MIELLREIEALKRRIEHLETAESGTGLIYYGDDSTITGWDPATFTAKQIYYKRTGKTVDVYITLSGTSNSTSTSFTLPFTSLNGGPTYTVPMRVLDNGGSLLGMIVLAANSATVNVYTSVAAGAWTNSGTKQIVGHFRYET
jgi:hypothetical protein